MHMKKVKNASLVCIHALIQRKIKTEIRSEISVESLALESAIKLK